MSIVPKTSARTVTVGDMNIKDAECDGIPYMLISDGKIVEQELKRSGHGRQWLDEELKKRNLKLSEVFIASLSQNGTLLIQKHEH